MKHWFSDLTPFRRDPLAFLLSKAEESCDPVARLHLGPKPVWLLTDPQLVRAVLRDDEETVDKGRHVAKLKSVVGNSTLTINGEENRRRRGVLHGVFARGMAQRFVPEMTAVIRESVVGLLSSGSFSAHEFTAPLTLRMICIAMFGKGALSAGDEQIIVDSVRLIEDDVAEGLFRVMPFAPWTSLARRRRRVAARQMMDTVVRRVRNRAHEGSAVAQLLGLGLTEADVRDEIVTMLLAGHHTTGSAAAWILYYLATIPGLSEELAAEARAISSPDGELRPEVLPRAPLSLSLVREVLRLYPSAHWFSRDAKKDFVLGAKRIAAGDTLIISPWQLHRDRRQWTAPERLDLTRSHTGKAFLPFGAGPRVCIGMGLAMLELQLIALEMAAAFELSCESAVPAPWPTPSVTLVPPPIQLSLNLRHSKNGLIAAE